jgi:hypothetical protein
MDPQVLGEGAFGGFDVGDEAFVGQERHRTVIVRVIAYEVIGCHALGGARMRLDPAALDKERGANLEPGQQIE